MRVRALATDYDGTIAQDGEVKPHVVASLERVRASGRKLILVTGRELEDLVRVFPRLDLFDRVVAENGALLFDPEPPPKERPLARPLPFELTTELRARGVSPLAPGRIIVATWQPHERTVRSAIQELGLELEIVFDKGAVMVLPAGVDKATGLARALDELSVDPAATLAVGDAENDHALLAACGIGVAVANAVPALKERADFVTAGARGDGVVELVELLLATDLAPRA